MNRFKENDKSQALCDKCGKVSTTFKYRSIPVSDSQVVVPNLLVGVCDQCQEVVSIPQQSVDQIKAAIEE